MYIYLYYFYYCDNYALAGLLRRAQEDYESTLAWLWLSIQRWVNPAKQLCLHYHNNTCRQSRWRSLPP